MDVPVGRLQRLPELPCQDRQGARLLDSATRPLRYNIVEIAHTVGLPQVGKRYVAATVGVALIGLFAFYEVSGQPAGLALWSLFGTANRSWRH
ncbi:MAG: hypothetical protein GY953_33745 [bacterium]|nr:hypothetical protein [bacterium]